MNRFVRRSRLITKTGTGSRFSPTASEDSRPLKSDSDAARETESSSSSEDELLDDVQHALQVDPHDDVDDGEYGGDDEDDDAGEAPLSVKRNRF